MGKWTEAGYAKGLADNSVIVRDTRRGIGSEAFALHLSSSYRAFGATWFLRYCKIHFQLWLKRGPLPVPLLHMTTAANDPGFP